ncbi:tRNA adenosine deaminase-associated protein [Aestuariimicrobium kwangyangense]|uniref:tRNA adenosine deaminase-associated protein n=1 Tax=Aestuariimicrobium kwangyangense TaxID=396389 RepID=UPI0003B38619|nr:tRNA adenosine deaminase-associated protein [Aestuariimicrobium kwangyangense]
MTAYGDDVNTHTRADEDLLPDAPDLDDDAADLDDDAVVDGDVDVDDDDDDDDDDSDDEDDDDSDDDDSDDEDDDDLEDATAEDIDCVVALYREDGLPVGQALAFELANDLDELIDQLRRLPGDAGALGAVSIAGEFFVLVRVRGRNVQTMLSDSLSANDWPLARDVVEFLGLDVPDEDEDDSELVGDLDMLADLGISEFDLENLVEDLDESSDDQLAGIAKRLKFGPQFQRAIQSQR